MPRGPGDFIHPPPELHFPQRDYVKLHVTLLATTCVSPNVTFLARNSGKEVASLEGQKLPRTLYASTLGLTADEVEFNAISYLTELDRGEDAPAEQEWIVKVFSLREVSDEWLRSALGDTIGWVSRKEVSLTVDIVVLLDCVPCLRFIFSVILPSPNTCADYLLPVGRLSPRDSVR